MMEKKTVIIVIITVISLLLLGSLLFFSSRFVGRAIYSEFAVGQAGFSVENNKFLKSGEIALPVYVNIAEEAIFFKFTVNYGAQLTFQEFAPNLVDFSGMVELNKVNLNNQLIYAGAVLPNPDSNVPFRKLNRLVKLGTLKFRAAEGVNLAQGPVMINLPFTNFEVLGAGESNLINSLVSASIMVVECLQDGDCGSGSCQNNRCAAALPLISCSGTTPAHALLCSNDDRDLRQETAHSLVTDIGGCTESKKCEWYCDFAENGWSDCNNNIADGCEVDILNGNDKENCGECGHSCLENQICDYGTCVLCTDNDMDNYCLETDNLPGGKIGGDCDDSQISVHPGVEESCDGKDNNCDGIVDGLGVCHDKNNCGAYGKACTNRNNVCSGGECLCGMNEGCGGNLFCNPENEMGTCESCPQGESWNGEDCVLSCVGLNEVNALKSNIANVLAGKSLAEINQYLWDIFERYDMECGK